MVELRRQDCNYGHTEGWTNIYSPLRLTIEDNKNIYGLGVGI